MSHVHRAEFWAVLDMSGVTLRLVKQAYWGCKCYLLSASIGFFSGLETCRDLAAFKVWTPILIAGVLRYKHAQTQCKLQ